LKLALEQVHSLYYQSQECARRLAVASKDEASRVVSAFKLTDPAGTALVKETQSFSDEMLQAVDAPNDGVRERPGRAREMLKAWTTALSEVAGPSGDTQAITDAVNAYKFGEAVAMARKTGPQRGEAAGGHSAVAVSPTVPAPHAGQPATAAGFDGEILFIPATLGRFQAERAAYERGAEELMLLQSVIVGLLFILAAYGIYADSWVGTYKEMMALFVIAFGADLSSEGIVGFLKKT
jgi:hypothetical protein